MALMSSDAGLVAKCEAWKTGSKAAGQPANPVARTSKFFSYFKANKSLGRRLVCRDTCISRYHCIVAEINRIIPLDIKIFQTVGFVSTLLVREEKNFHKVAVRDDDIISSLGC